MSFKTPSCDINDDQSVQMNEIDDAKVKVNNNGTAASLEKSTMTCALAYPFPKDLYNLQPGDHF